jgi:hypothetical protein
MSEALLHDGKDFRILPGFGIDHPVGMKTDTGKSRGKEIPSSQTPQHRAFKFGEVAGRKQAGQGRVLRGRPGLHHLMNGSEFEAAGREMLVDIRYAEGERILAQNTPPLDPFDLLS